MPDAGQAAVAAPIICALFGALASLLSRREPERSLAWGYGAVALTGILAATAGGRVLFGAASPRLLLFAVLPGDDLALHLTPLSAFFLLMACLLGCRQRQSASLLPATPRHLSWRGLVSLGLAPRLIFSCSHFFWSPPPTVPWAF